MPFEISKSGDFMQIAPAPAATCTAGGAAFPGDSPFGYYEEQDGGGGLWGGDYHRLGFGDRLLQRETASSPIGYPSICGGDTGGVELPHVREGYGVKSRWWTDALHLKHKGAESLLYYQERRTRRLLKYLAKPVGGFATGIEASAYDASFCSPARPVYGFDNAAKKAYAVFSQIFPPSRWTYLNHQLKYECDENYKWTGRWAQSAKPTYSPQTGCAISLMKDVGRVISYLEGWPTTVDQAFIPLREVLHVVMVGETRFLAPLPWLENLYNCLVPGWNKMVVAKQEHAMAWAPTAKPTVKPRAGRAPKPFMMLLQGR